MSLRNNLAKNMKRRIRREKPFHAVTPFENGGGVDENHRRRREA